ncbi:Zinc finger HIT domain-containing protein [Actinidia chinensis var. chinensis]|uniref:Zinc finger HIT domain-containing protein n=1 Tax=Actinidia chinensis var. chinensis TaxID=1590841 RepID=A0A2R6Q8R3_ACTCC|nr:Zinc finger HIT domain-containing protein [Actinidia chinensis var. chinensis]
MLDILKRFRSEEETDSMDEDDSTLSEKTVQKILTGYQVSLDDLSAEEKKRFQRAVTSGDLSKSIEPWEPWWLKPSARTISLRREGHNSSNHLPNKKQQPRRQMAQKVICPVTFHVTLKHHYLRSASSAQLSCPHY